MASIAYSSNSGSSSNRDMRDSVDWGGVSGHNSLAGVSLICGVVDVWSLNDLLDGVDLVGSWDMDGTWDSNRDINVVFLDIDLWDNVGDLRGDSGVGSHGSSDLGLDNGVSGSRASWDRCWGDGSIRCWGSRDGGRGKSNGFNEVLGFSSNVRVGRLGDGLLSSNGVSMSSNNLLDSGLDGPLSDNSVLNTVLNYWGSSSIAVVSLTNNSGGAGNWSSNKPSVSGIAQTNMCWGTISTSHKGNSNTKSVHVS